MKKLKNIASSIVYTNSEADSLIRKEVPQIIENIKGYALDLAAKGLPCKDDLLAPFLPNIKTPFQSLLEKVHKLIGAERVKSEIASVWENFKKEKEILTKFISDIAEDIRLLRRQEKQLNDNLKHHIRNWHIALFFLVLLSFSESLFNYKIFLPISTNNFTSWVLATGIGICLFIISHAFKSIINLFSKLKVKILVGAGIIGMVTGLLYTFAKMRLAFISEIDNSVSENISEWNFVLLNLVLFLSGVALVVIYKPSKELISDYQAHKKVEQQIKSKQNEQNNAEKRLSVLTEEKNKKIGELEGIILMAHNYEKSLEAEYQQAFALWCSENLISRKQDSHIPNCFSEKPTPLTTYFSNLELLTLKLKDDEN